MILFFQHNYACLNEKLYHMNGTFHRIEMLQSIHIQYMIKYFIKCCNYLNYFKNVFVHKMYMYHVFGKGI